MANNILQVILRLNDADFKKAMGGVQGQLTAFGQRAQRIGQDAAIAFLGLGGAIAGIVKTSADFERGMANISTIVDTSVESMDRMGQEVLNLAKTTPVAIGDLTQALYDVRSAGFGAQDSMTIMAESAKLAVAGLSTTSEATDIMTSALSAFKGEGLSASQVANILFTSVQYGKQTVADMSQAFGAVAPILQNAGVSLADFAAGTAALTSLGIPAAEAQNGIRAAVVSMLKPTAEMQTIFKALGVESGPELIRTSGGIGQAFSKVRDAAEKSGIALEKATGRVEGSNTILAIAGSANATYARSLADMTSGVNVLDEAYKKQTETLNAKYQVAVNRVQTAMIALGNDLRGAVLPVVEAVGGAAEKLTALLAAVPAPVKQVAAAVAVVTTAILGLVAGFGLVGGAVAKGVGAVLQFGSALKAIPGLITAITVALRAMAVALGLSTGGLTLVLGLAAVAIAGLGSAIAEASRRSQNAKRDFSDLKKEIDGEARSALDGARANSDLAKKIDDATKKQKLSNAERRQIDSDTDRIIAALGIERSEWDKVYKQLGSVAAAYRKVAIEKAAAARVKLIDEQLKDVRFEKKRQQFLQNRDKAGSLNQKYGIGLGSGLAPVSPVSSKSDRQRENNIVKLRFKEGNLQKLKESAIADAAKLYDEALKGIAGAEVKTVGTGGANAVSTLDPDKSGGGKSAADKAKKEAEKQAKEAARLQREAQSGILEKAQADLSQSLLINDQALQKTINSMGLYATAASKARAELAKLRTDEDALKATRDKLAAQKFTGEAETARLKALRDINNQIAQNDIDQKKAEVELQRLGVEGAQKRGEAERTLALTRQKLSDDAVRRQEEFELASLKKLYDKKEISARDYFARVDEITQAQAEREIALLNQQIENLRTKQAEIEAVNGVTAESLELQNQILELEGRIAAAREEAAQKQIENGEAVRQSALQYVQETLDNFQRIVDSFGSTVVDGLLNGTLKIGDAFKRLGQDLIKSLVNQALNRISAAFFDFLKKLLLQSDFTFKGLTGALSKFSTSLQSAFGVIGKAATSLFDFVAKGAIAGLKTVFAAVKSGSFAAAVASAHEMALAAAKAVAGTPVIGPALAVATYASMLAFGLGKAALINGLAAFEVGSGNVPFDMPAMVHQGEIIVPANFSDALRRGDLTLGGPAARASGEAAAGPNVVFNNPVFMGFGPEALAEIEAGLERKLRIVGGSLALRGS